MEDCTISCSGRARSRPLKHTPELGGLLEDPAVVGKVFAHLALLHSADSLEPAPPSAGLARRRHDTVESGRPQRSLNIRRHPRSGTVIQQFMYLELTRDLTVPSLSKTWRWSPAKSLP